YLLALLISFEMLQLEWSARSATEFWKGLFLTPLLLQGLSPSLATFWNTVAWTLSSEVAFYAAFPWLIRLPWPRRPSRLILLLLVFWVIDILPATLYLIFNPDHLTAPVTRYTSTTLIRFLKYTPIPYAATFMAGITTGRPFAPPAPHAKAAGCHCGCCAHGAGVVLLPCGSSSSLPAQAWRPADASVRVPGLWVER